MSQNNEIDIAIKAQTAGLSKDLNDAAADTKKAADKMEDSAQQTTKAWKEAAAEIGAALGMVGAAMVALVAEAANYNKEMRLLAQKTGESFDEIQGLAFAVESVGLEAENLGDISKDVKDKLGDFIATGGGEFQQFFEKVAPKVGLTAQALQGLSGPDVLIAVKKAMDDANVSAEEQVFYLESIADEASALAPLLADGGRAFKEQADKAREYGLVLSDVESNALTQFSESSKELTSTIVGAARHFSATLAPAVGAAAEALTFMLNNAVKPLLFGIESMGAMAGVSFDVIGRFFEFVTSPSKWNKNGFDELTADVNRFGDAADSVFTEIAAKYAGISFGGSSGFVAPKLTKPWEPVAKGGNKAGKGGGKAPVVSVFDPESDYWEKVLENQDKRILQEQEAYQKAYENFDPVTDFWDKVQQAQDDAMLSMESRTEESANFMTDAFSGAVSSISGFFEALATGQKVKFRDLITSIQADLTKMAVKRGITEPLDKWMSGFFDKKGGGGDLFGSIGGMIGKIWPFANGGIMSAAGALDLPRYANGGVVTRPQLSLIGEGSMNEAYVPLPDGRSIPVTMQGGGGGNSYNVTNHFTIKGPVDSRTEAQIAAAASSSLQRAGRNR